MWLQKIDSASIFIGDIYPWTLFGQHICGWFWWRVGFMVVDSIVAVLYNQVGRLLLQPVITCTCTLWSVVCYFAFFMLFFQVWPLTQFFLFLFVQNHWFAWRANQWPLVRETLFSSVPPSNSLVSVSDPRRAFWADQRPSWALDSSRALLPELQRYKDTVCCVVLGAEVLGHRQHQLTQTLIVRL